MMAPQSIKVATAKQKVTLNFDHLKIKLASSLSVPKKRKFL